MNDFTKDELEHIKDCLSNFYQDSAAGEIEGIEKENLINQMDLIQKTKRIIDNYCEHEIIVTGAYSRSNPPKKCDACGVLYYE